MTFHKPLFRGETTHTVYRVVAVAFADSVHKVGNLAGSFIKLYVFDKCGNILATYTADTLSTTEAENIAEVLWKGFVEYGE